MQTEGNLLCKQNGNIIKDNKKKRGAYSSNGRR